MTLESLATEIVRQLHVQRPHAVARYDDLDRVTLDGEFDMVAIAAAIAGFLGVGK